MGDTLCAQLALALAKAEYAVHAKQTNTAYVPGPKQSPQLIKKAMLNENVKPRHWKNRHNQDTPKRHILNLIHNLNSNFVIFTLS